MGALRVHSTDVVSEVIDGEVVIVNLKKGLYFSSEATGAWMWRLILDGKGPDELVSEARTAFGDVDGVEDHVAGFVSTLKTHELVVEANGTSAAPPTNGSAPVEAPTSYSAPTLQVYSDMEDLLLLDPVHDVDENAGWPNTGN